MMNYKTKITTFLILLISLQISFAQTSKTFNGDLDGGKMSYQYYENENSEMIRNGKFSYSKKLTGYSKTISGFFKNGVRSGAWRYSIIMTNYEAGYMTQYHGFKKMSISYLNGKPHGLCTFSSSLKNRHQEYVSGGGVRWGNYDKSTIVNITMRFNNGVLAGAFSINDGYAKEKHSGKFNNDSLANGTFISTNHYTQTKTTAIYLNGVPIKFNKVSLRTGKILYSLSHDAEQQKLHIEYANNRLTTEQLYDYENYYYEAEYVHSIANIDVAIDDYIYTDDFLYYEIGGDEIYNFGDVDYGDNLAIILQKISYQTLGRNYQSANKSFENELYDNALDEYQKILHVKQHLSKSDKTLILAKAQQCKQKIKETNDKLEKLNKIEFDDTISQADKLFNNQEYSQAIKLYKISISIIPNEQYPKQKIKESNAKLKSLLKAKKIFNENVITFTDKASEVNNLYTSVDKIMSTSLGYDVYKIRKKKIYNAYIILVNDYQDKINESKNIFSQNILIVESIQLCSKVIELYPLKTNTIEKQLKKVTDVQQIKDILSY